MKTRFVFLYSFLFLKLALMRNNIFSHSDLHFVSFWLVISLLRKVKYKKANQAGKAPENCFYLDDFMSVEIILWSGWTCILGRETRN